MIGSGPFVFDNFQPDVAYACKKNPDYFEKGLTYVDSLRVAVMPQDYQKDYIDGGKGSHDGYFDKDMIILAGVGPNTEADGTTARFH